MGTGMSIGERQKARMSAPFAVVKTVDRTRLAGYYWDLHYTSPLEMGYDRKARQAEQAVIEIDVDWCYTRAEAEQRAAELNAANSLPGVRFRDDRNYNL